MNKKMHKCKTCGAEIAKSAKNCPSCGAKNKQSVGSAIFLVVILVFAGFIGVNTFTANSVNRATVTLDGQKYSWKEFRDMYHEAYINGNALEFAKDSNSAFVEMTGKVTQISSFIDGKTLPSNNIPTRDTLWVTSIKIDKKCHYRMVCSYYDKDNYDVSHIKVGDKVTVKGGLINIFGDSYIIPENLDKELTIYGDISLVTKK